MAFKYNPEAQSKYTPESTNFLVGLTKEQLLSLATDKSGEYKIRLLPPWSSEGIYAKQGLIHYRLGADAKGNFICPNMHEAGSCLFCNVYGQLRSEYEKFKVDLQVISAKRRYYSNVLDLNAVTKGVLVFSFGTKIYKFFEKYQQSGDYGDITDLKEGRNLTVSRTVEGKSITDIVMVNPKTSDISDSIDDTMLHNLDTILPEPNLDLMERSFDSHPWKIYEPQSVKKNFVRTKEEVNITKQVEEVAKNVAPAGDKMKTLAALEAKLKAGNAAQAAS